MYKAKRIQDSLALSLSVILFIAVSALFINIFIAEPPIEKKSPQTAKLKRILDKPTIKPTRNIQLPPPPVSIIQPKASKPFKPLVITPDTTTQEKLKLPPLKAIKPKLENSKSKTLRASNKSIIKKTRRKSPTHPNLISQNENDTVANGRVLLRQLENGNGPEIQIAWPDQTRLKEKIYDILNKCYGMQTARMNSKDELFHSAGPSGVRWAINMDKMSGFIREVSGLIPQAEHLHVRRINQKHPNENFISTIRIFPRVVDAHLLMNLRSLAGENYSTSKNISAAYGLKNNSILIQHVRVDGKELGRAFMLPSVKNQCP